MFVQGSLSMPSETVQSNLAKLQQSPALSYSPIGGESFNNDPIQRNLVPSVAALNRREFLKFESLYQVKEEQPRRLSRE